MPYTRGEEVSRPSDDILFEIAQLAAQGVREVNLLGQNVNAWRGENYDGTTGSFADLLRLVAAIDGIDRIRFTTSHPIVFTDDIIEVYRDTPELVSFLHLPVQSGSDRILNLMGRTHTALEYKAIIRKLRAARPDIQISSDFIVGFPGDTTVDFEKTMKLIADVNFDMSYSFIFSARPGTPAADMVDDVPEEEKKQRLYAYEYNGYWKDVGTLGSYWEANMELIDLMPEFNLYEEYWKIYTKSDIIQPQYLSADSIVEKSIIGEGSEIYGEVHSSVIGAGVTIGKGSVVRDSIIMKGTQIGENVVIDKAIIAENCSIGDNVTLGVGEEKPNKFNEKIYSFGLVTIGEDSEVPSNVSVGKNTAISGKTTKEDFPEGILDSGEVIIKAGDSE